MFDEKRLKELGRAVKKSGARRVLLQAPEGLKTRVLDIAAMLEKEGKKGKQGKRGIEVIVTCDPCYGGCDLADMEAKTLGCDLLVHIGHTELKLNRKTLVPVIYEEYALNFNPVPLLKRHLKLLRPCKNIWLVTTAQFVSSIGKAKKFLQAHDKKVFVGQPSVAKHPGQVLGCDYSAAEPFDRLVDCFLYLGTGRFHPIGLATKVKKPVLVLDFELSTLENMHRERDMLLRIRAAHVEKAKDLKNFGILVSTKPGQQNIGTAEKARQRLEKKGKNAWILAMNEITPSKLLGMKLECLVNCTCPRLTEDFRQFRMPILNPEDVAKL
jgi:2-(3-amino-3-carboxypropyl)histidine synthase